MTSFIFLGFFDDVKFGGSGEIGVAESMVVVAKKWSMVADYFGGAVDVVAGEAPVSRM
jgi:hypothetical protein